MDTNKIFIDMAQRAHEFAEMCRLMQKIPDMPLTAEVKDALDEYAKRLGLPKADPEAWREENRKKQAAGVRFEHKDVIGNWGLSTWDFCGRKEDYREVPQEVSASECQKALEHLAKTYSADKGTAQLNPTIPPHAAERALYWAQRVAGTNEMWQEKGLEGTHGWIDWHVDAEPAWDPECEYRVKPMKLTASIVRRKELPFDPFKLQVQDWEFTGTREEYRAECEKYGYVVVSEIKEVKPKTVKYYFALIRNKFGAVDSLAASSMISFNRIAEKNSYIIIGDIEEREIEA